MNDPENATPTVASPRPADQPDIVLDAAAAAETLPDLLAGLADGGDPVLVAIDGEPRAALVSAADLADLRRLRRAERRRIALAELERSNAEWVASGLGFDDDESERIGKELGSEINRAITERLGGRSDNVRRSA